MVRMRIVLSICFIASLCSADVYPIILRGTVTMEDGSAPPFIVGIERVCSDSAGSAPGPITNKKGEYIWRMDIDPLESRACFLRATHPGYSSSTVEIRGMDTTRTSATMAPLVLNAATADAGAINVSEGNIPLRAKGSFNAAMKALDKPDFQEAERELQAAVKSSPKFAQGWHALGVIEERLNKPAEAKEAFEHAIESEAKWFPPYVTLARVCLKTKDWAGAVKAADSLIKADSKRTFPEIYLHRAVARYEMKELDDALANVQEAIRLDPKHKRPRAEYVLGRILEAKGDTNGAREHFSKYLELEPAPIDVDSVKGHLQNLGKPEAPEPALEPL